MQPVVIQVAPTSSRGESYNSRISIVLGSVQVTVGVLCLIINIAAIVEFTKSPTIIDSLFFIGHGIWCGAFFIVTGSLGIGAGCSKHKCLIIGFMVMSILSAALFVLVVIAVDALSLHLISLRLETYSNDFYYIREAGDSKLPIVAQVFRGLHGTTLTLGIVELIVAICSSAICCKATCCSRPPERHISYIQNADGAQQVAVVPQAGYIPRNATLGASGGQFAHQTPGGVQNAPLPYLLQKPDGGAFEKDTQILIQ